MFETITSRDYYVLRQYLQKQYRAMTTPEDAIRLQGTVSGLYFAGVVTCQGFTTLSDIVARKERKLIFG